MSQVRHTQGKFCWYECATSDAAKAKAFYAGLFGWTAEDKPMPGEMGGVYATLKLGDREIAGLYEMNGPMFEGVPPHWGTYVWVDDVDATAAMAKELGGQLLFEPMSVPGVGRMAAVKDPQGAVLSVWHSGEGEACGTQVVDASPGSFCWSELMTTDPAAAKSFYSSLIGWTTADQEMGPGMTYTSWIQDECGVGGMMGMAGPQWEGVPPNWMSYVSVADADETVAKTKELGGKLLHGPQDIPNVGRFAVLQDPTGAVISIIALQAKA